MKTKDMQEAIVIKNGILQRQSRRIELLEEKMTQLRRQYFQLKYAGLRIRLKAIN